MDAGDRNVWQGDQDERPLTDLGWEQARAQAEALAGEKIDALYTSPALRARQTLGPLAERLGLEVHVLPEIGDDQTWRVPDGWDPEHNRGMNVPAYSSGRAMAGIGKLQTLFPDGHVVACSHGHVIPALDCTSHGPLRPHGHPGRVPAGPVVPAANGRAVDRAARGARLSQLGA